MIQPLFKKLFRISAASAVVAVLCAPAAMAITPKEPMNELDALVFIDPQLRVVETTANADEHRSALPGIAQMDAFRAENGDAWQFTMDLRRGVPTILAGGAIPFIPGNANELAWNGFAPGCTKNECIPVASVEALARDFLTENLQVFGVSDDDLVLDSAGSGPIGASIYLLRFQPTINGIPVERSSVFFRINNGNLIHVATENVGRFNIDTNPTFGQSEALNVVENYLGPFASETDTMVNAGSLLILPVTPAGQDPDDFRGSVGNGIDFRLAWKFAFRRSGVLGTWEAVIDAHSGELLRFVDSNRYGKVHGGAYPGDNHTGEADRPFPFADTGLPAPNQYADIAGLFPGDSATTSLQGKFARINDACGSINNSTSAGDVDFGLGGGTDCDVPAGNTGGPGNTHSARTQYYHLTAGNLRAQSYLPDLNWLKNSFITVNTNDGSLCNASSGGDTLYFHKAAFGCWNLGEIPGVALHEWGHSLDNFDGSGGQSTPVETYADWMAALHLHDSCVGRGFFSSGNCGGYGDPCTNCSGIRELDFTQHQANTPWTAANYGSVWSGCNSGNYFGPCNLEDHCEAGISEQALWDFVNRKLTAAPYNMDLRTAWILADRLWYSGLSTLAYNMYNCSVPSSDGCNSGSLYNVMMAMDDDGDGTANGTPHAAAIFEALNDHKIACGAVDAPQNQNQSSCPALAASTLSGEGFNNLSEMSWTPVANATRYLVFRNDIGCDAGMAKIADVAGATTYSDPTVANDLDYYYVVQAVTDSDSCAGPVSNCEVVTPEACQVPGAPSNVTASAAGDHQINVTWTSDDPVADSFNIYRAIGACPQGDYELLASEVTGGSFLDTTASGLITYSYIVTAKDFTGGCESEESLCDDAQTTGACTEAPGHYGLKFLTNPGSSTCTLDLEWDPGIAYCGGPVTYNVYRSTTQGFDPMPGDLLASGITGTGYSDIGGIDFGTKYYYVVRAVDSSNGSEDDNLVELSNSPTGASSMRFEDDFEGGNLGWVSTYGTPPASTGEFVIGDPVGTTGNYGGASQPEDDHTPGGVNCLYTDENPGGDAGSNDVDNGEVIATSPTFDGSGLGGLTLDMWRWFFNEDSDDTGDYYFLEVSNDNGSTWTVLENVPGTVTDTNVWTQVNFDIGSYVSLTSTMKIRVRTADGPAAGDLIELAIDDIAIEYVEACESTETSSIFANGFESGTTAGWSTVVQ